MARPSKCNLETYTLFLMSTPHRAECTKLAEIMENMSHDAVNKFLLRANFTTKTLFSEVKQCINLQGGILSIDDTVLDKEYSNPEKTDLISYFWSGKHHKPTKGINLITLFYSDLQGNSIPVNFRIYDPNEKVAKLDKDGKSLVENGQIQYRNKTKNEYYREMLEEVLEWGLVPSIATGDCWYSTDENLKFLRDKKIGFCFGLKSNRIVSNLPGEYRQIKDLVIPKDGLVTHLKKFGFVKVFKTVFKNQDEYFAFWLPEDDNQLTSTTNQAKLEQVTFEKFETVHNSHWKIETYHRAIKQLVGIEKFMVRKTQSVLNHIFCSIRAFCKLEFKRINMEISNWYQIKRDLYKPVVKQFILSGLEGLA